LGFLSNSGEFWLELRIAKKLIFGHYNNMANWDKITSEGNVEDRRGNAVTTGVASIGMLAIVGVLMFAGGASPDQILRTVSDLQGTTTSTTQGEFVDTKKYKEFAAKIIGSNNEVWQTELGSQNIRYTEPKLVLFRGTTESECGGASSAVGPHYCPVDQTIYLDETFFEELTARFGAKGGDVAESYVIAHEVGHHIQKVLGTLGKNNTRENETSIKVELQADCYAGVWAGNVQSEGIITESEIDQAIDAAESVGDDRIQKSQGGKISPETWTHGSSADRKIWFLVGYSTQNSQKCNTIK
jgi:uncharacterized protein